MDDFNIELLNTTNINNRIERSICQSFHGRIFYTSSSEDAEDSIDVEVGEIVGYRLFGEPQQVLYWTDEESGSLSDAICWLAQQDPYELDGLLPRGCLYLEKVEIQPKWRGKIPTLRAVAAFIEGTIHDGFVFLQPSPIPHIKAKKERMKQVARLKHYWSKLGISHYDEDKNYLWEPDWFCPKWLAGE